MIKYLIEKEFKQMFRSKFMPRMIVMYPILIMIFMPFAANSDISNLNLCVIDNDHSVYSERLVNRIEASTYFKLTSTKGTYYEGLKEVESDRADILLVIPPHLERYLSLNEPAHVWIAANSVNAVKGSLGISYLSSIVSNQNKSSIPIDVTYLYNKHQDYKLFMVPGLVAMILIALCGFLPALNIVKEKEVGTMDQINVTPVNKFTFIIAKLIPYWVIGFVVLTICFIMAWAIYGFVPVGNLGVIYLGASIFVLAVSGLGLIISNNSDNMQQAMFVMWFCMIVFMMMSGLLTPIQSMPQWAQDINVLNPLKYFIQIARMVFLRGSSVTDIAEQLIALSIFAIGFNTWAVLSYRKSN